MVNSIFNYENLASASRCSDSKKRDLVVSDYGSKNVLACDKSKLSGCFFNTSTHDLLTVDENLLIRLWDLKQGICKRSYPLEIPKVKGAGFSDENLDNFKTTHTISSIKLSADNRNLVVAFEGGMI